MSNIIPFGKYKGQPIEAVAEDRSYVEWLTAQPWFQQRYGNLYQIVINNFCEPFETPEHNEMQARFLAPEFVIGVAMRTAFGRWYSVSDETFAEALHKMFMEELNCQFKYREYDREKESIVISIDRKIPRLLLHVPTRAPTHGSDPIASVSYIIRQPEIIHGPVFEDHGCDVRLHVRNGWDSFELSVEIKPQVGDDYPAILRQMDRSRSNVLLLRQYHGTGVDKETFIRFFASQKICVVFESEVIPEIPEEKIFDAEKIANAVAKKFISAGYRVHCPGMDTKNDPSRDSARVIDDLL